MMRNPSLLNLGKVVMHDCASILGSIAKRIPCFYDCLHGASHPYIPIYSSE